jgi:hypothetical protein
MNSMKQLFTASLATLACSAAFAQAGTVQRDVNQQTRIEQGLQSGQLSTREAARLEKGEARIEKMQSRALADGKLSDAERARLNQAQNAESKAIANAKHNAVTGNPNSASSQRMQADVQRNINQQTRIEQGVKSGALTNREVAGLERGQARVDRAQARAGRDGHVGAAEQARIQSAENRQSGRIYGAKRNGRSAQ